MPHHTPLISTIVAALVLAFILGALAHRLRLPPIVGYLIAENGALDARWAYRFAVASRCSRSA